MKFLPFGVVCTLSWGLQDATPPSQSFQSYCYFSLGSFRTEPFVVNCRKRFQMHRFDVMITNKMKLQLL